MELKIDPEFRDKIPQMPEQDFNGLRDDILRDGYVRDPLVVWKEENTLLDGHNRWKIIQENWELLKDKYKLDYKSFQDRYACIAWICANQLHKHNMNDYQKAKLIQEEYDARQKSYGGDRRSEEFSSGEIHHLKNTNLVDGTDIQIECKSDKTPKTRQIIAKEHNITEGMVKTAVEFGRGVDRGEDVSPGFKNEILSGVIKAAKSDIANLRKLDAEDCAKAVEAIRNGERPKQPHGGFSKKMREQKKLVDEVVSEMYSPEVKPFSIEMLEGDIELNGRNYIELLRSTLIERSTLLVGENRKRVAKKIDEIINEIQKVRRLTE